MKIADVEAPDHARRQAGGQLGTFLLVYAALYGAYGTFSPFFTAFLQKRHLAPEEISTLLAAGIVARLVAGPLLGRLADRTRAAGTMLALFAAASGLLGFGYLVAAGFWLMLAVHIVWATATAPVTSLADALAIRASDGDRNFHYGWARGTGSAAFVAGTLLSGQMIGWFGYGFIIVGMSTLFLVLPLPVRRIPRGPEAAGKPEGARDGFRALVANARFRRLVIVAALIGGSHALNDTFAVILWGKAGIGNGVVSVLWSVSVVAEILVFLLIGRPIIQRLGPALSLAVAAAAGGVRWTAMAMTTAVPALFAVQALHGLSFALMHLAAMAIIAEAVPANQAATAQTVYGTLGIGSATALLTWASGPLFKTLGANAFWIMLALCLTALPLTWGLRGRSPQPPVDKPRKPRTGRA